MSNGVWIYRTGWAQVLLAVKESRGLVKVDIESFINRLFICFYSDIGGKIRGVERGDGGKRNNRDIKIEVE